MLANKDREKGKMDKDLHSKGSCHAHRVIASLNREQVDFLDKIGKDAQFSSGSKLSRNLILAAMVNALKRLNLTGNGVTTIEQFEQRIVDAMRQNGNSYPARRNPSPKEKQKESFEDMDHKEKS